MDVSKGIFNFRDVREVQDDKGTVVILQDSANDNKTLYGKTGLIYEIQNTDHLQEYKLTNDWGDTYSLSSDTNTLSTTPVWYGHTMTFTATAKGSHTEYDPCTDNIQAPYFTASVFATSISLTVHNPNDYEVEFVADDTGEILATIDANDTYTYSDYRDLLNCDSQGFHFEASSVGTTYDYAFRYSSLGPWYTSNTKSWVISTVSTSRFRVYTRCVTSTAGVIWSDSDSVDLSDVTLEETGASVNLVRPFIAIYDPKGYGAATIDTTTIERNAIYNITSGTSYALTFTVDSTKGFYRDVTITQLQDTTTTKLSRSSIYSSSVDNRRYYSTHKYTFTALSSSQCTQLLFAPDTFLIADLKYLHINNTALFHGPLSSHSTKYTIKFTANGNSGSYTAYSSTYHYFTDGITLTGGYWPSFGPRPSGSTSTYYAFGYSNNGTKTSTYTDYTLHHQSTASYLTGANNNPNVKYQLMGTKDLGTLYAYVGWDNYTFTATTELTPTISSTTPYIMTVQTPKKTTECWCDNEYQFTLDQTIYVYMVFSSETFVNAAKYLEAHTDLFMFQDPNVQFYNSTPVSFATTLANTTTQTLSTYTANAARHLAKEYCRLMDVEGEMNSIVAVRYTCNTGTYSVCWCGNVDDSDSDETVYYFYGKYYNGSSWVALSQTDYITVYYLIGTATTTGVYYKVLQTTNAYVSGMNNFIQTHNISTTHSPYMLNTYYLSSTATYHYTNRYLYGTTMDKSSGPYMHFIATSDSSDHSTLYLSTMSTAQYTMKNFVSAIYSTQSDDVTYYYMASYFNYSTSGGKSCYWNGSTFVQLSSVNSSGQVTGTANLVIMTY